MHARRYVNMCKQHRELHQTLIIEQGDFVLKILLETRPNSLTLDCEGSKSVFDAGRLHTRLLEECVSPLGLEVALDEFCGASDSLESKSDLHSSEPSLQMDDRAPLFPVAQGGLQPSDQSFILLPSSVTSPHSLDFDGSCDAGAEIYAVPSCLEDSSID
jgi:hypothetical protein